MLHYHYLKVIADSENMSPKEIASVLQKYFAKQNDGFYLEIDLDDHAADFDGSGKWLKRLEGNISWLNGDCVALSGVQQNNPDDGIIDKISAIRYLSVHNKE